MGTQQASLDVSNAVATSAGAPDGGKIPAPGDGRLVLQQALGLRRQLADRVGRKDSQQSEVCDSTKPGSDQSVA
jgi:hypothetical protein